MATTKREPTLDQLCNKIEKLATGLAPKCIKMKNEAFMAHMLELNAAVNHLLAVSYQAKGYELGIKIGTAMAAKTTKAAARAAPKK